MLWPVFDGHNDTLTDLFAPEEGEGRSFFERSEKGQLDLPRAREGGLMGGIFAIYTPPPEGSPEGDPHHGLTITEDGYELELAGPVEHEYARGFTDSAIDFLYDLVEQSKGNVGLVRAYQDLEDNLRGGVLSIVLHLEGAAAIEEDLSNLEAYYERGVRSLGLVWSRPNVFGSGVPFRFPHSPDTGPGLTEAGKRLVGECNRLGIMVDLAHINEQGWCTCCMSVHAEPHGSADRGHWRVGRAGGRDLRARHDQARWTARGGYTGHRDCGSHPLCRTEDWGRPRGPGVRFRWGADAPGTARRSCATQADSGAT
jgi:hypothetical protein